LGGSQVFFKRFVGFGFLNSLQELVLEVLIFFPPKKHEHDFKNLEKIFSFEF
jgi:hypothetical protein